MPKCLQTETASEFNTLLPTILDGARKGGSGCEFACI